MSSHRRSPCVLMLIALLAPGLILAQPATLEAAAQSADVAGSILFVENTGQWPAAARFQAWGSPAGTGATWLTDDAIWITVVSAQLDKGQEDKETSLRCGASLVSLSFREGSQSPCLPDSPDPQSGVHLKLTFPGANPDARIEPLHPLTTTVSYFVGNDPEKWHPAVPVFAGVRYADLYPGIDLVFGEPGGFWRLQAEPDADITQVRMQVDGAEVMGLDAATLRLAAQQESLAIALPQAPFTYQIAGVSPDGEALALDVRPYIDAPRQPAAPKDDPGDLIYSTFLGGFAADRGFALALEATGRATLTGDTGSYDFPTTPGVFDPSHNGQYDAFVLRLNTSGSALDYATILGGNSWDHGKALALDPSGRAIVTGVTESSDFPVTPGAYDPSQNADFYDAFVVQLNSDGSALDYATYLGGNEFDSALSVALDAVGRFVVAGTTNSSDFPTTLDAFDPSYNVGSCAGHDCLDVFVVRFNAAGSALDYATFLGGSSEECLYGDCGIAVDSSGRITVVGYTDSGDFPTTPGAFDTSHNGGPTDAFVLRLNAAGSALDYATFLGGSRGDQGTGVALDANERPIVTGATNSSDFPTTFGAFDTNFNSLYEMSDVFVVRLNATGSALDYATFLGGSYDDFAPALALDTDGRATVSGVTDSNDFPTTSGAFDTVHDMTDDDAFVVRFKADGSGLYYASFFGGGYDDSVHALALDTANRAIMVGDSWSADLPTTAGAVDPSFNGIPDAFVSKLDLISDLSDVVAPIEHPTAGGSVTGTIILAGFAIDLASNTNAGIDRVHVYLDGPYGSGNLIGGATYGLDRPDVAAQYGARFGPSGWELVWNTAGLAPGMHRLYLYAHRIADNAWKQMPPHWVIIPGDRSFYLPLMLRR